nr:MAG TPA: hypothetical protein [Bacteriophage sp.]
MAKTNYITVEVASKRGYTQVKVNGGTGYKNNIDAFRNAPVIDVLATRVELLKLLRTLDEAVSEGYEDK